MPSWREGPGSSSGGSNSSCLSRSLDTHTAVILPNLSPLTDSKKLRPTLAIENVGSDLSCSGFDVGWLNGSLQVSTPSGRAPLSFFDSNLYNQPQKGALRARTASSVTFHSYKREPLAETAKRPYTSGGFNEDAGRHQAGRMSRLPYSTPAYPPPPHSAPQQRPPPLSTFADSQQQQLQRPDTASFPSELLSPRHGPSQLPLQHRRRSHSGAAPNSPLRAAERRTGSRLSPTPHAASTCSSPIPAEEPSPSPADPSVAWGRNSPAPAYAPAGAAAASPAPGGGPAATAAPAAAATGPAQQDARGGVPTRVNKLELRLGLQAPRPGTSCGLASQGPIGPPLNNRPSTGAGGGPGLRVGQHGHHPMAAYKPTRGHSLIVFNEMDLDKNGKLTKSEFEDAAVKLGFSLDQAVKLFRKLDKRNRGYLESQDWGCKDWAKVVQSFTLMYMQRFMGLPDITSTSEQVRKYFSREKLRQVSSLPAAVNLVRVNAVTRGSHATSGTGNAVFDAFSFFDSDGSGDLSKDELRDAFFSLGVFLSDSVVGQIMEVFDRDGDGIVNYHEFIRTMFPATSRSGR